MLENMRVLKMNEMISVIVPVYNVEKYLRRCVNSILKQSYPNLQIILVDDGSTDRCGEICEELKKTDDRITVIHKENGGLSDARNAGLEIANGEYITFIDSDDYVSEYMVQIMYDILRKEHCKLIQCELKKGKEDHFQFKNNGTYAKIDSHTAFESRDMKISVCGKLYHRSIAKELKFKRRKINEDEFYTYRCIYESSEVILYHAPLYYYFQQPDSIMHKKREYLNLDVLEAYEERIKYFEKMQEKRLVDISIKEKCIRETLLYFKARGCRDEKEKRSYLLKLFQSEYAKIKRVRFPIREFFYLRLFHLAPIFVYPIARRKIN